MNPLFGFAKDYRKDIKQEESPGYIVAKKNKDGSVVWQRDAKHTSHSALKTLKALDKQLDPETLAKLAKKDPEALKDIRYLAKNIHAGYRQKYVKTGFNFLDTLRIFVFGKKSEPKKVERESEKIIARINKALEHESKALEKEEIVEELKETAEVLANLKKWFDRGAEDLIDPFKGIKTVVALKKRFGKIVDIYMQKIPNCKNLADLRRAKREMDFLKDKFEKTMPWGHDAIQAKYADFYKAYKLKSEQLKRGT